MPFCHLEVWFRWESFSGKDAGEWLAIDWVGELEALDRFLEKGYVLVWLEQQLNSLPSDEALGRESWNGRWCVWVSLGLEGVIAAE